MFKVNVTQTPFTTEDADAYFSNIQGDSFGCDYSFLATLRALLAPRMQEDEKVCLAFGSTRCTSDQVAKSSVGTVLSAICGAYSLHDAGQMVIHSFNADQASNMACFKIIESTFTSSFDGYHRLDKLRAFYSKSFAVDCYINPDLKSVIVFVDNMDNKKMHYLQVSILAMLPWYFDPEKGMTKDEMALAYSLRETTPEKYIECLSKMAEQYDFKAARVRLLLAGFETRYERAECDSINGEISAIDDRIRAYNRSIGEQLRLREEHCIRLMGLETKIANGEKDDSEIMEYFIRNTSLVLGSVRDTRMTFCVKGYLEYFDAELAERAILNRRSFVYSYGFANRTGNTDKAKRLMSEIFLKDDPRLKIRFCAAYQFDIRGNVQAIEGYDFGYDFMGYMPNTHINEYACMGDYSRTINELLQRHDYIGALEQCVASCKSLNWGDHAVMCRFMEKFWSNGNAPKCIELPDGRVMNAKEAIEWLEEQDKAAETEAQNGETTKEETQNEQAD